MSGTSSPAPESEQVPLITRHPRHNQYQTSSLSEGDQQTVGASSNVTNALRRTHDLIAAELARSEFAHETLTESSAALKQLNESYTSLDTMLANSKDLLGTLLRSQKSDTWYLQTALYMLMVTGAWLVFRRLLYGPLWWFVWLPFKIFYGTGTTVGSAVWHGVSGPGESSKVQMGEGNGQVVDVKGIQNEGLPTANVGQDTGVVVEDDPDSLVNQVGKIVDAVKEAEELGSIPEEKQDDDAWQPNPGEGAQEAVVVEDTRARDEL